MARDTKTYANFLSDYQRLCGIDTLSDDEKEFALSYFNRNHRFIARAYDWPFLCLVEERTPDADDQIDWAQAGETVIGEVMECWRDDPFGNGTPRPVPYHLTADGIQLYANASYDPTYVQFRTRVTDCTGEVGYTYPYDFHAYIVQASYADWLSGNEQIANGAFYRNMAQEILLDEIDQWNRQQKQQSLRGNTRTHGTEQTR